MNLCTFSVGRMPTAEAPERTLNRIDFSHINVIISKCVCVCGTTSVTPANYAALRQRGFSHGVEGLRSLLHRAAIIRGPSWVRHIRGREGHIRKVSSAGLVLSTTRVFHTIVDIHGSVGRITNKSARDGIRTQDPLNGSGKV